MRITLSLLAMGLVVAWTAPGAAQSNRSAEWPNKPVRIVVPFGPGSSPDIVTRLLADSLQRGSPGSTFIVENKPGASGNIGTEAVAKAEPDGSTIGVSIGGPLAINTILFGKLKYDPTKDVAPITLLIRQPSVLVVNAGLGTNSVAELIAVLRMDPGKYIYGSIGTGSLSQLAMEAIAQKAGVKMVHLPLAGSSAAMIALMRGDVQLACLPAVAVTSQLPSQQFKVLAVSTAARSPFLPDTPTLTEAGIPIDADAWLALIAPGGTPPALVARMNALAVDAIRSPAVRDKLAEQKMEAVGSTPAELRAVIDAEIGRWEPVIKASGIKIK